MSNESVVLPVLTETPCVMPAVPAQADATNRDTVPGAPDPSTAPYVGRFLGLWCGFAANPGDRGRVASGGMVTTLLATALRSGTIDGAAVSKASFDGAKLGYRFDIVTDPDQLGDYAGSAYYNIPVERHWKQLDRFDGRLAVCALPCHTAILRRRQESGRGLANVNLFISLFCGHNNEADLIRFVFEKEGIDERQVASMWVERTYLGGSFRITFHDGSQTAFPFRRFNVYRSLWFFSKQMCRYCDDHLGQAADVSIGDVFLPEYRKRSVKHSLAVARTETGWRVLRAAIDDGVFCAEEVDPLVAVRAQKRILIPSADSQSRYYACRLLGFPGGSLQQGRFRLRSFLTYSLLHFNDRLSQWRWGRTLLKWIPRPLLYAYIALIKLLNNTLGMTS
jgi:coenzyme F420-reducing hydrogenase beta subunit